VLEVVPCATQVGWTPFAAGLCCVRTAFFANVFKFLMTEGAGGWRFRTSIGRIRQQERGYAEAAAGPQSMVAMFRPSISKTEELKRWETCSGSPWSDGPPRHDRSRISAHGREGRRLKGGAISWTIPFSREDGGPAGGPALWPNFSKSSLVSPFG